LTAALAAVYSDYEWLPWKFSFCPNNFWDDVKNHRKFLDWAAKQLNVNEYGDWYRVTANVRLKGNPVFINKGYFESRGKPFASKV
jgi:hypothetical protein